MVDLKLVEEAGEGLVGGGDPEIGALDVERGVVECFGDGRRGVPIRGIPACCLGICSFAGKGAGVCVR